MKLRQLLVATALAVSTINALAQNPDTSTDRFRYDRESPTLYYPNEVSLDLFGTYADRDKNGAAGDFWGGGLGLNYFLTRYIGIGADSYIEEWKAPYRLNGSLFLRVPIDSLGLAPYAFGGGGREWKYSVQWTEHVGGGLELRFNRNVGIFADGRRVFCDVTPDYWLARFGLRLVF